jgi:hypothetical protein
MDMKPKEILLLTALFCLCSCSDNSSDRSAEKTCFSLGSLYEDNPSRLRFSVKKKEDSVQRYEKISERWRMDFLMQAELHSGTDSLY